MRTPRCRYYTGVIFLDYDVLRELPMGFGMALAENLPAMRRFSSLTAEEQRLIVDGTHGIASKEQMRAYVERLTR